MAVQKNFVVKNGLEVNTDLLLVNADTGKVGIGTTRPEYLLEVQGGIGVTNIYASGIATVRTEFRVGLGGTSLSAVSTAQKTAVGIGTSNPLYTLDVRGPVSLGQTTLYVKGDAVFTGDVRVNDIFFDETEYIRVSGILTAANIYVFNRGTIATGIITQLSSGIATITTLDGTTSNFSGIATIGSLNIASVEIVDSSRQLKNIVSLDPVTIATVQAAIGTATAQTFQNMVVVGLTTLSQVDIDSGTATLGFASITTLNIGITSITSGIVTSTSGVTTYYGDGKNLTGTRIGIRSEGSTVSLSGTTGTSIIDFKTSTGQNVDVVSNSNTGVTTVTITPGVSLGLAIALGA